MDTHSLQHQLQIIKDTIGVDTCLVAFSNMNMGCTGTRCGSCPLNVISLTKLIDAYSAPKKEVKCKDE